MPKHTPTLVVGHYPHILRYTENRRDRKEINDLLQREGVCEVVPRSTQESHQMMEFFVITQRATIMLMRFDTKKQCIVEPIKVNEKIKDLLGSEYEISRCRMAEFLNLRVGGPGFTLLIAEHDLVC